MSISINLTERNPVLPDSGKGNGIMKRPLFVIGLLVFLSSAAALLFGDNFAAAVSVFLLVCGLLSPLLVKKARGTVCLLLAVSALSMANVLARDLLWMRPVRSLAERTVYLEGLVTEVSYREDRAGYLLAARIPLRDGRVLRTDIRLSSASILPVDVGEDLRGYVTLSETDLSGKYRFHSLAEGLLLRGVPAGIEVSPARETGRAEYRLLRLRQKIRATLRRLLPPREAAMVNALLVGDRSDMGEDLELDFRRAGLTHLTAVSGFHLSLVTLLFAGLLRALGVKKRTSALLSLPVMALFMALAGFTPSVMRAGVMLGLCLIGTCLGKKTDALSSLGLAAAALCLWNPYSALSAGFLLSFSATLGILLLTNPISRWLQRLGLGRKLSGALGVSLAAFLLTLPVMIFLFDTLTLLSPLASLLAMPLATLLLWCALPMLILGQIPFLEPAAQVLAGIARVFARSLEAVAHAFSSLPAAFLPVRYDFVRLLLIVFYAGAVALFFLRAPGRVRRLCALLGAAVFAAGWATAAFAERGTVRVVVFEGVDAALIASGSHASLIGLPDSVYAGRLIDTYCREEGITSLDLALGSTLDNDHAAGAVRLFERLPPSRLILPGTGEYTRALLSKAPAAKKAAAPEEEFTLSTLGAVLTVYPCSCGRACKIEIGGASLLKCNENCVIMKTDLSTQAVIRGDKTERLREDETMKLRTGDSVTTFVFRKGTGGKA